MPQTYVKEPIDVLAIDDHPLLREGIAAVIESEPGMRYVDGACSAREGLDMFRSLRPDVTLLDIELPDTSGIDLMASLGQEFPQARVVMFTTYRGDTLASRVAAGSSNKRIGADLGISESLVSYACSAGSAYLGPFVDPATGTKREMLALDAGGAARYPGRSTKPRCRRRSRGSLRRLERVRQRLCRCR